MSQYHENFRSFVAGATVAAYRFVKLDPADATKVVHCTTDDNPIGVSFNGASSGGLVNVHLKSQGHTSKVTAHSGFSGTFSGAVSLYGGISGWASEGNPAAGTVRAYALEDAAGAGSVVEILWA